MGRPITSRTKIFNRAFFSESIDAKIRSYFVNEKIPVVIRVIKVLRDKPEGMNIQKIGDELDLTFKQVKFHVQKYPTIFSCKINGSYWLLKLRPICDW